MRVAGPLDEADDLRDVPFERGVPASSSASGKRRSRSCTTSRASSPSAIVRTPRSVAATSTAPSEHAPTATRMRSPGAPARHDVGVMPRTASACA